jgi:leucyl aminopeptidase (aminopeptidase T)
MGTLLEGARNAVEVCMGVRADEHVLIVTDKSTLAVGKALNRAAKNVTKHVEMYILENYGTRPMKRLPEEIKKAIPQANVTFWAAQSFPGELHSIRGPFTQEALKYARHGHMPSVNVKCMKQGMCSNYKRITEFTAKLYERVKEAKKIEVSTPSGTELKIKLNPQWKWLKKDGIYHEKGGWGNLPEGELFTSVPESSGHIAIDELGDWFSDKYGCLTRPENKADTPVHADVKNSRINVKTLKCANSKLKHELVNYLKTDENSNRAGEFAFPTNLELITKPLIGNLLQDEKARVHHAFGDPYPELTGANWKSKTHIDALLKKCSVWVDGKKIMKDDKYLV